MSAPIAPGSSRRRLSRWSKYRAVLVTAISERFVYRTDFFIATLLRFAPIATTILLWQAVFAGSGRSELAGYRFEDVVAYYLFTTLGRAFSSMPGLAMGIAREIREGTIRRFLLQPIDLLGYLLACRVAHKLVYYLIAAVPFVVLFTLCGSYLPGWPTPGRFACGIAALVLAFLLGFYLEASLGMLAFWFLEISGVLYIMMGVNYFFSGHMIPLELLPSAVRAVAWALPFQYLAYFPATVWLQKTSMETVLAGLLVQAAWVAAMICLSRILLRRGLRRYTAFGG